MGSFFKTEQLTVGYNGKPLIRDIELRLEKGRILVLIGPNGSGKSTILKTITKYLQCLHGTVYIGGSDLRQITGVQLAKQVSVVLTQRLKTEHMTCEEVVETGRYPYTGTLGILSREDHAQVESAMALSHALELREKKFGQISDGQRQRVLLARAICQQPEIIVLDEPTTFLDIHYKLELMEILHKLAKEKGIAVILSLHELDIAQRIADDVLCVKGATIDHYGSAEEIFHEELIQELYDLKNGAYNPLFGNLEMTPPSGVPKVFVIAGGGTGIPVYRKLQKMRVPFITGILQKNDVDYQVARVLGTEVVSEQAFEHISEDVFNTALQKISVCEKVINCLSSYGELNDKNRVLLQLALSLGCRQIEI